MLPAPNPTLSDSGTSDIGFDGLGVIKGWSAVVDGEQVLHLLALKGSRLGRCRRKKDQGMMQRGAFGVVLLFHVKRSE